MKHGTWFPCTERDGGLYAPFVTATLELDGEISTMDVLIDSGSSRSLMPSSYVDNLLKLRPGLVEEDTGIIDVSGEILKGLFLDVNVTVHGASRLPVTHERFLVGDSFIWPILGMTWFEKVGVHFKNFRLAPQGRRFALYPSPFPENGTPGE